MGVHKPAQSPPAHRPACGLRWAHSGVDLFTALLCRTISRPNQTSLPITVSWVVLQVYIICSRITMQSTRKRPPRGKQERVGG